MQHAYFESGTILDEYYRLAIYNACVLLLTFTEQSNRLAGNNYHTLTNREIYSSLHTLTTFNLSQLDCMHFMHLSMFSPRVGRRGSLRIRPTEPQSPGYLTEHFDTGTGP